MIEIDASQMDQILKRSFEDVPAEVLTFDAGTLQVTMANKMVRENVGYAMDELVSTTALDLLPEYDAGSFRKLVEPLERGAVDRVEFETLLLRRDGTRYEAETTLHFVGGPRPQFLALTTDTTSRNDAQRSATLARNTLLEAIEVLPDGFVLYDRDDRLVVCNSKYKEIYAESAPAIQPGATFEHILRYGLERGQYAVDPADQEDWLKQRLADHLASNVWIEQKLANGRWLRIREKPTPAGGRVGLRIDITNQVNSRERAEQAEQRLSDAIEALPAGFWLFDSDDRLVIHNQRVADYYNLGPDALVPGRTFSEIIKCGLQAGMIPSAIGCEDEWLDALLVQRKRSFYEDDYQMHDGRWIKSVNQRTSDGGMVGFRMDITELRNKQLELEEAAQSDPLTGLPNRRAVNRFVDRLFDSLGPGDAVAVLHLDLDKFKAINDIVGHDAGDYVLVQVARRLKDALDARDIVARVGGDEFLVLLRTDLKAKSLLTYTENIRQKVVETTYHKGRLCQFGSSVGVCLWSKDSGNSLEDAMVNADIALNDAKRNGRNRCTLFTPQMRQATIEIASLAQEIRESLRTDRFVPFFQPQVDAVDGRVIGFESLARWEHPNRGLLTAGAFMPAAEEDGLIGDIDRVILEKSLDAVRMLESEGFTATAVSINMSEAQLSDPIIVDKLKWAVDQHGIRPQQLRIEILESTLLHDRTANVVSNIHRLSSQGFAIELDDFGTGHTAITSLRQFPVERIKIDRSLVAGIDRDPELRLITEAIVGLGRKLGMKVLGEGVETPGELAVMRDIGCTCIQGYLLGMPMPISDIAGWWRQHEAKPTGTSSRSA